MEMSTDITEMKRLEKQLRTSQERYQHLFEDVPCHVSIQDRDLNIVEANRAFREDFGSCFGRKCYEVYQHRTDPCYPCPVLKGSRVSDIHCSAETNQKGNGKGAPSRPSQCAEWPQPG